MADQRALLGREVEVGCAATLRPRQSLLLLALLFVVTGGAHVDGIGCVCCSVEHCWAVNIHEAFVITKML